VNASSLPSTPPSTQPVLTLEQVTCGYEQGRPAIHGISLTAHQDDILCLLGPSGCGKTTTLRAIAGFETVLSGKISLNQVLVSSSTHHVPPERRHIGMVFQDYALFPHLRIADNVAFGLSSLPLSDRTDRVKDMLAMVGLTDFDKRFPHELSGGQQQRVALARALAPQPVVLLLDEPFSNLDPDMTYKMREELHQLLKDSHTTTILVTHDHEEAFTMADRIAVLEDGHLSQCNTPEIIYHLPASPSIAKFVGQADFITGTVVTGGVQTEIGIFPPSSHYQGDTTVLVMVRPDDVRLRPNDQADARIEGRLFRGSENLYTIRLASGQLVHCYDTSTHIYPSGTTVELTVIATHTVLFEQAPT